MFSPNSFLSTRSNLILAIFVTTVCFVVTYLFLGFYFVEIEGVHVSFFSGQLTPNFPFRAVYFSGHFGVSHIYSYLYEHFPDVEWMSWIECSYLLCANAIGLYLVAFLLGNSVKLRTKIAVLTVVYFLVFADHNMNLIYTRLAYMVCGVSLLGLLVLFHSEGSVRTRWGLFVFFNLFFTIGTLTRAEASIACFLLIAVFGVFYIQEVKKCLFLFLYPALLLGTISIYMAIDIKNADNSEFYKQVEPDIEEQFTARGNKVPLSEMKTHRDSVMWITAAEMIWPDPKNISAPYLRSLIMPEKFMFTDSRQWQRVYESVTEIVLLHWQLALAALLLSILVVWQYGFQGTVWQRLFCFGFVFSFWVLTLLQAYTDKVNDRSFVPYLSLFVFCHILLLARDSKVHSLLKSYYFLSVTAVLFCFHLSFLLNESKGLKADLAKFQRNLEKLKQIAGNRYLVLNSSSFDYLFLSNVPFHPINYSAFKRIYITEGYIVPFLPYYKRYLESECKCDIYAFPSFWNYLKTISNNVVIVSSPSRIMVLKDYMAEIHQYDLPIMEEKAVSTLEQPKSDDVTFSDELKVYVFSK